MEQIKSWPVVLPILIPSFVPITNMLFTLKHVLVRRHIASLFAQGKCFFGISHKHMTLILKRSSPRPTEANNCCSKRKKKKKQESIQILHLEWNKENDMQFTCKQTFCWTCIVFVFYLILWHSTICWSILIWAVSDWRPFILAIFIRMTMHNDYMPLTSVGWWYHLEMKCSKACYLMR